MLIYQLFTLVSLSFVKKAKRANFLNFCKQILPLCIVSLNSCVRVVRVRAVYPIILPHFKAYFITH